MVSGRGGMTLLPEGSGKAVSQKNKFAGMVNLV